jgi:transcriptional regulator with XRE-family HTH domain
MDIGEKIRQMRENKDISQVQLARLAGISNDYMNKIETGKVTNIGIEVIIAIVESLQVRIEDLIELKKNTHFKPTLFREPKPDFEIQRLLKIWDELSSDQKNLLKILANEMLKKKVHLGEGLALKKNRHLHDRDKSLSKKLAK